MLLQPHRKKMVTVIVDRITAPKRGERPNVQELGEESETGEYKTPSDDELMGLESALSDFSKAMEAKDFRTAALAFRDAMSMCGDD